MCFACSDNGLFYSGLRQNIRHGSSAATTQAASADAATSDGQDASDSGDSALLAEAMSQVAESHSSTDGKDETVYVITDGNGTKKQVIVSDWLKNKDGSAQIDDKTDLSDIENVKGYGYYTMNDDGTITWDAESSDIYYQGTTDKSLPVDVKITYWLDGNEIAPDDLAGKSGHVKIRFDYTNNQTETVKIDGKDTEIKVPLRW